MICKLRPKKTRQPGRILRCQKLLKAMEERYFKSVSERMTMAAARCLAMEMDEDFSEDELETVFMIWSRHFESRRQKKLTDGLVRSRIRGSYPELKGVPIPDGLVKLTRTIIQIRRARHDGTYSKNT